MEKSSNNVCVTGASGYIGSWLVRELLKKGYAVHATLRNTGDESKAGFLKSFDGAGERLQLFEADIYDAEKFEPAIEGCVCVFLVATPFQHITSSSQYRSTTEASVAAVQIIMRACERSPSVKRVVYSGSVMSASPWKEDGSGYEESFNESCWTALHLPYSHMGEYERDYTNSKTETEKELLLYNSRGIQVVSLVCGLVGGDTILPYVPGSMSVILSPLTGEKEAFRQMKALQTLLGSVPLVHIEDVCNAHIFCMENTSISGRFFCVGEYPTIDEIVAYFEHKYPNTIALKEYEGGKANICCSSTKLLDIGFEYKHGMEQILLDSVACGIRLGAINKLGED